MAKYRYIEYREIKEVYEIEVSAEDLTQYIRDTEQECEDIEAVVEQYLLEEIGILGDNQYLKDTKTLKSETDLQILN